MHGLTRSTLPVIALSALLPAVGFTPAAHAASATPAAQDATGDSRADQAAQLFVHYVLIAKPDQAADNAAVLLAEELSAADLARVVERLGIGDRMDEAFRRAREMDGVADAVGELEVKLETGRKQLAREYERMVEAVNMLTGPVRGQMLGKDRLLTAGEYAVPLLLTQVVEGRDAGKEVAATRVLVELKRQAALPLTLVLPTLDPNSQRKVATILGEIGYPVAVPALLKVAQQPSTTTDVRQAALAAVRAIGAQEQAASTAYSDVAARFLAADATLMAFPDESTQNIWNWSDHGGLGAVKVSTELYYDVMAMFFAQQALELDPTNRVALALFVAGDLRREARLTEDMEEPLYSSGGRSAQYFATLAGAAVMQDVLSIGLGLNDTGLICSALHALRETAGADAMIDGGESPVVQCLLYPDRRVQFEAALTLASVSPAAPFPGAEQVVPMLAQAVRSGGQLFGGIITPATEDAQRFGAALQASGYVPLTAVQDAGGFEVVAARNAGADLVVISGSAPSIKETVASLRARRGGMTLPVLVVGQPADMASLRVLEQDGRTVVIGAGVSDEAFAAGIAAVMARTYGGAPSAEDMSRFVPQAIDALLRIGLQGGGVYRIADGERGLIEALRIQEDALRVGVASVLALVPTEAAQRALLEAALSASGDEQTLLLGPVAASAKRWGSKASPAQSDALRQIVTVATGALADAAATAYGALNLPSDKAVEMILKARQPGAAPDQDEESDEEEIDVAGNTDGVSALRAQRH